MALVLSSTSLAVAATASPEPGGDPAVTADDEDAPTITTGKEEAEPKSAKPDTDHAGTKPHKADEKAAVAKSKHDAKPALGKHHPPAIKPPPKPKPLAKAKPKAKKPHKPKKQALKPKSSKKKLATHKPTKKKHHGAAKGPTRPASTLDGN